MSPTPSDYELTLRVRDHDRGDCAFEELLRRHKDIVYFQANQFCAPGQDSDDIEQAALTGLWTAARTFRPDRGSGFRHFVQLAVRAEVITAVKTARRGKHRPLNEAARLEMPVRVAHDETMELGTLLTGPASEDPCEVVIAAETFKRRLHVLSDATRLERTVAVGRMDGQDYDAIGRAMGRSTKSVDNALQRVRTKLKAAA